ncbi:lysosomal phospholipase A and acyltransferase-like isoform X2 [Chironomus tepperi]|uniref:lysosomal phospholipase A and acyltransferase-like isoform X2 n=1 Tax=Chironomus tepperi TaxID=113505 RepID=UPI00391F6595
MRTSLVLCFIFIIFVLQIFDNSEASFVIRRAPKKPLSPVIFVPGDGGSQVDVKLNKPSTVHIFCTKTTKDYFNVWLNLELLAPLIIDCWTDNAKLHYDNVTRTTSNSPGVEHRIPGWGDSETVEWIDPSHAKQGAYFKTIGNMLVANGYVRNVSMRGAPFDFRKGPSELGQYFIDLKKLTEDTYELNDNEPITYIAHSMGAPMLMIFFQQQTEAWKEKYVRRMITVAGAWAGSAKAVKVFTMGDDLGSLGLFASEMKPMQISMPSLAFLLPFPAVWKPDEVLVSTPSRNYTHSQLNEYFTDLGYPTAWEMRKDNLKFVENFAPPNVEIHCLYSTKMPTVERLHFKSNDLSSTPELIYGDGDGSVNLRSSQACTLWRGLQKQSISTLNVEKVEHFEILHNEQVVNYIKDLMIN